MTITIDNTKEVHTGLLANANDRRHALEEVRKWIDFICVRKGWNGSELARRSGLVPSTILRLKNSASYACLPTYSTIRAISLGSGFRIPDAVVHAFGVADEAPAALPMSATSSITMMPVRYLSSLPANIQFPMPHDDEVIERPARLTGKNAFAFRLDEHALEPLIPHGSMMYAIERDPRSGDLAVVTRRNGRSIVRLVEDIDDDGVEVIEPKGTTTRIDRSTIRSMGVVVINERT